MGIKATQPSKTTSQTKQNYQDNSDRCPRQIGRINCDVHVFSSETDTSADWRSMPIRTDETNRIAEHGKLDRHNIAREELIQRL